MKPSDPDVIPQLTTVDPNRSCTCCRHFRQIAVRGDGAQIAVWQCCQWRGGPEWGGISRTPHNTLPERTSCNLWVIREDLML